MNPTPRELPVALGLGALALMGLAADWVSDPAPVHRSAPAGGGYVERAAFCPPGVADVGGTSQVAIASSTSGDIPLGVGPAPEPVALPEGSFLWRRTAGGRAVDAVGYGGHPVAGYAGVFRAPAPSAAAARCSESPSGSWYLPAGSSLLEFDERLLLYNPFPDEAVAEISL